MYDLSATHRSSLLLNYAMQKILRAGHEEEVSPPLVTGDRCQGEQPVRAAPPSWEHSPAQSSWPGAAGAPCCRPRK